MHSGMKTYGCELCGKSFLDSLRLRMHLLSHSGRVSLTPTQHVKPATHRGSAPVGSPGLADAQQVQSPHLILCSSLWATGVSRSSRLKGIEKPERRKFLLASWSLPESRSRVRTSVTLNLDLLLGAASGTVATNTEVLKFTQCSPFLVQPVLRMLRTNSVKVIAVSV